MRKNELIRALEEIPGNPPVFDPQGNLVVAADLASDEDGFDTVELVGE